MVLASGLFDEVKIESLMREHGATVEQYKDKRLIVVSPDARRQALHPSDAPVPGPAAAHATELALAFLKPGLVAVGSANLIRQAVDLEHGGENITSNAEVMNLIRSIDSGNVWAVGRFDAIQSAARLPPVLSQLPAITWFSVTGQINDTISGVVRAETRDEESAKNLRDVVNGFLALARLQAGSKPEFQALAQSLQLSGTGKTVELAFSVPGALFDLIEGCAASQPRQARARVFYTRRVDPCTRTETKAQRLRKRRPWRSPKSLLPRVFRRAPRAILKLESFGQRRYIVATTVSPPARSGDGQDPSLVPGPRR